MVRTLKRDKREERDRTVKREKRETGQWRETG